MSVQVDNFCEECGCEDTLHYDKKSGMYLCRGCKVDISLVQKERKSRGNRDGEDN